MGLVEIHHCVNKQKIFLPTFSSNCALLMLSKHLAVAGDTEIKVFYRAVVILSDSENRMAHELLTSFSKM